jgi:hypothetical protein
MTDLTQQEEAKFLSKLLYDVSKFAGGKLWSFVEAKYKVGKNYFHQISYDYLLRFHQRYGYIQVLGMHEPMALNRVFVDIKFLDSVDAYKRKSIQELVEEFKKSKKNIRSLQISTDEKLNGIDVANVESRLMVVGPPGGGKSTYLRKVGIESLNHSNGDTALNICFPILVELKNIDHTHDLNALLLKELEIAGFPHPEEFLNSLLKNGKGMFLFDGLDEVPSDIEDMAIKNIRDFCDQHNKNRFIISCRTAAYKGGLNNFKNIEIANFDHEQIKDFISKWFKEKNRENPNNLDVSEACWKKMNSAEFKTTLELAQTPILLTLLCLVYHHQQDFPKNRALLYQEAISVLLKEWNAEKRIHSNPIYNEMTLPFEELLLSNIAYKYFAGDHIYFQKEDISSFISNFMEENLNAPKYLDGSKILEAISVQQGILMERAKNIYSFSHLTFQEYFTAKYIDDHGLVEECISKYIAVPKWREIFILLSGIMKIGADRLLNAILKDIGDKVRKNTILLNLVNQAAKLDENTSIDKRLFNLILILSFCTNYNDRQGLSNLLKILNEFNPVLEEKVSASWISDAKPHIEMHKNQYMDLLTNLSFKNTLVEKVLINLSLEKKWTSQGEFQTKVCQSIGVDRLELDETNTILITNFTNHLIFLLECKNCSIHVSKKNWDEIKLKFLN